MKIKNCMNSLRNEDKKENLRKHNDKNLFFVYAICVEL